MTRNEKGQRKATQRKEGIAPQGNLKGCKGIKSRKQYLILFSRRITKNVYDFLYLKHTIVEIVCFSNMKTENNIKKYHVNLTKFTYIWYN